MTDDTAERILSNQLKRLAGNTISNTPALEGLLTTSQAMPAAKSASVSPAALTLSSLTRPPAPVAALSLIPGQPAATQSGASRALTSLYSPVLSGVLSGLKALFGNNSDSASLPAVRYTAPAPLRLQQAISASSGASPERFDLDARGLPRLLQSGTTPGSPQITIHVQALDSKSIQDHSTEIANALRAALLQSHSLNDLLQEY